tara:strand:- start:1721 stop:2221 length:501 start_codon:yes stop_codon:yes gene_type:complete
MLKKGKINIKGTLQGNTNTPGQERTPSKEFSFEEIAPSVWSNDENTFLEGSGTLDNRVNGGSLILGQNLDSDGLILPFSDVKAHYNPTTGLLVEEIAVGALNIQSKKLFTKSNLGSKIDNKRIIKKTIKTPAKTSGCTNRKACNYDPFVTTDDGSCCTTSSCGCYQ